MLQKFHYESVVSKLAVGACALCSEEVEEVLQCVGGGFPERDSREGSQLVGVLTWGRDCHGSGPVEVHVAHLVRDPLELVCV